METKNPTCPPRPEPTRSGTVRRVSGTSLIEVMLAMIIITGALIAMITALLGNSTVTENSRELSLALNAARTMIETLQDSEDFTQIFNNNTTVTTNYLYFTVTGLIPIEGATGAGMVSFPGSARQLLENVTDTKLGMPRDLNGDGAIDGVNHASNYKILPVTIRIEWQSKGGTQFYQLHTILVSK